MLQAKNGKPFRHLWSLALVGAVLFGVSSEQVAMANQSLTEPAAPQLSAPQSQQNNARLPRSLARQVRRDLAQRLNIPRRELSIVNFSQETWPDSCLGVSAPNESCAAVMVEGWRIEVSNGQQNWIYRTDRTGQAMRLETTDTDQATLPSDVSDRLLQAVADEVNVPVASLRITEAQPAVWDGCMGIFVPGRMCTQIAISGYRVIVAGENQSWVYHISSDGSRVVQNTTASGSRGGLIPTFMPAGENPLGNQSATLVFRMIESGGLAGNATETFLMSDGVVYRRTKQYASAEMTDPVIVKRLSPQQVQQFQQVLQDEQFRNLDRLRYLSDAAFADYPTITLQGMGSLVEYIDLEEDNLPQALQTVIQAWKRLN
ncbi:MAG TPA: hypothetical protein V6C78_08940 [Crinalium sp.]